MREASMRIRTAAEDVANRIAALAQMDDVEQFAPIILGIMKGVKTEVFVELDEKPGRYRYCDGQFYMLRQVRNHSVYGRQMFGGFKK